MKVLLVTVAMLFVVVSEHRGFAFSFVIAFACAIATLLGAERYPPRPSPFCRRNVVGVLWLALAIGFVLEANAWASAGKPSGRLLGFSERGSLFNLSIDTDPHLQEAASPQVVVVRSFLR